MGVAVGQKKNPKKKEFCESTLSLELSPWSRAAAVTQLLAAVLHLSARRTAGKLKGRTWCRPGARRSLMKDFYQSHSHSQKLVCCFPMSN